MSGIENFKGKRNGFENNPNNINTKGRPHSPTHQLKKLLTGENEYLIPLDRVEITDEGVKLILPTSMDLAAVLMDIAMNGKGSTQLKAIEMIIDRVDGKAKQPIEVDVKRKIGYGHDPEFFGELYQESE